MNRARFVPFADIGRFVDWVRDLGFMQKPGVETKAARDAARRAVNPPAVR